jgi:hypothetical protein
MPNGISPAPAGPDGKVDGRWSNERGSVLELEVHDDGRVTGTFRLASDGNSYRPHPVTGTYTQRPDGGLGVVGSVIGWPRTGSVTVWTGAYDETLDELHTRWLMTETAGGITYEWPSVGGDVFRRVVRSRTMARAG